MPLHCKTGVRNMQWSKLLPIRQNNYTKINNKMILNKIFRENSEKIIHSSFVNYLAFSV